MGRREEEEIARILAELFEHTLQLSISWMERGQAVGLIKEELDAEQTAKMFITYAYGLEVRLMIDPSGRKTAVEEYFHLMQNILKK